MALSTPSTSTTPRWKYEVFLSFRGADTRDGITSKLYDKLQRKKGIKTFMDDQAIEPGDAISPTLLTAIKESRFAIIVLSPQYATSGWCLEELTAILQGMGKASDNRIMPLFYGVDPADVRYQKGSFEDAFKKHKSRQDPHKVQQWRNALQEVACLSGWDSKMFDKFETDTRLIEDVVKLVWRKVLKVRAETLSNIVDFEAYESTRVVTDRVMKALKDDSVTLIGVHGMGGVGKTAMVQHVCAQAREKGLFDIVITVPVSQKPDEKKIQFLLAEMLTLPLKEKTKEARAARLKAEIMTRSNVLIILDDIWTSLNLSSIGIPNNNELKICNSKIVLTTRIKKVCRAMRSQEVVNFDVLSEEDSLSLLVKNAGIASQESTEIYEVARTIARKCGGLPVALIAIVRALGDGDLHEWKKVAQQLLSFQPTSSEDERIVFECIKRSYNYLRSNDVKSCLLLCCLFPKDDEILIEDLLKYGIGIGLFQDSDAMQDARERANEVVKSLIDSSLLLSSERMGCVKMHDVIRDVAMSISSSDGAEQFFAEAGCELEHWPRIKAHKNYSGISLMKNGIEKLPEKLVCSKLKILLLQYNAGLHVIPDTFFEISNDLRVLNISGTDISSLSPSVYLLSNLHSLYLDDCWSIDDMSFLAKLKSLELLSMRGSCPKEFPKEIRGLTRLRMLDITAFEVNAIPSKVISQLSRLEELYMQCNFADWGSKIVLEGAEEEAQNVGFDEVIRLPILNILKVYIYYVECLPKTLDSYPAYWPTFDICIGRQSSLSRQEMSTYKLTPFVSDFSQASRLLTLGRNISTLPDWFIKVVVGRAEKLWYYECEGLTNIVEEYDHGRLDALRYLLIEGPHEKLEELMNTTSRVSNDSVFENLEELHVKNIDSLKQLCLGGLPSQSLRNLKTLTMASCNEFGKAVLPTSMLRRLQNLETVQCSSMCRVEYVFWFEAEHGPKHVTKLRTVRILDLENLTTIWYGPVSLAIFHNLRIMAVQKCHNLKFLFPFDAAESLLQLEYLWITDCLSLQSLVKPREKVLKIDQKTLSFPKLKILVLITLPQLTEICRSDYDLESPLLEYMYEMECPMFGSPRLITNNQVKFNIWKVYASLYERVWGPTLDSPGSEVYNNDAEESWEEYFDYKVVEHSVLHDQTEGVQKTKHSSTVSWQDYVDDYLMCKTSNGCQLVAAAIIEHNGEILAESAAFPVMKPEEVTGIMNEFNEPGSLMGTLYIGGTKFQMTNGVPGELIRAFYKGWGVAVKRTRATLLIGIHDSSVSMAQCADIVMPLGDYLVKQGF